VSYQCSAYLLECSRLMGASSLSCVIEGGTHVIEVRVAVPPRLGARERYVFHDLCNLLGVLGLMCRGHQKLKGNRWAARTG
jgi:hypothetical protein